MLWSPAGVRCGGIHDRTCRRIFGWPSWNRERRAQRKIQLKDEFDKGFVSELREYRKNGGKLFHATQGLLPRGEAVKFPAISGISLSGGAVSLPLPQPSLVLVSLASSGMTMCDQYRKQLDGEFGDKVSSVELSLLENAAFIWMRNWIEHNLKKEIASYRQSSFMVCTGKTASELRRALRMHSSMVGYAFLLDGEGLIRWRAHAVPTQEELQSMIRCTKELMTG